MEFGTKADDIDLLAGMVHRLYAERHATGTDAPLPPIDEAKKKRFEKMFWRENDED